MELPLILIPPEKRGYRYWLSQAPFFCWSHHAPASHADVPMVEAFCRKVRLSGAREMRGPPGKDARQAVSSKQNLKNRQVGRMLRLSAKTLQGSSKWLRIEP